MTVLRFLPRFRKAARELQVLEARENWSRAEIDVFQLDRVNSIWAHSIAHVPYYRALRSRLGLPAKFLSLAEFEESVPVLTKSDIQNAKAELLSEKAGAGEWSKSSGSSGQPTEAFWGAAGLHETLRCRYRFQASWGVDIFDRHTFLWSDSGEHLLSGWDYLYKRSRRHLHDWLRNRQRLSVFETKPQILRQYLDRMRRFQPKSLYSYSSAAYLLAREALATSFSCPSLKVAFLTAEPAFPHIVSAVEKALGVPAVNEYGSSECGLIAYEGPDRLLRIREDIVRVETTPRDDGRWNILVTMLTNPDFPLIRYAIGDTTEAAHRTPPFGFAHLRNVLGRNHDYLLSPSGEMILSHRVEYVIEDHDWIRRFQAHQKRDGSLSVVIEPNPGAKVDVAPVQAAFNRLLEGYPVQIDIVDCIPHGANGKHRWIVSELARDIPQLAPVVPELALSGSTL